MELTPHPVPGLTTHRRAQIHQDRSGIQARQSTRAKSLLRSRKSQVIIGNNKTSTKMPNVQIHTQRHLLGSENRCEGIARGIWRPGARLDQPRRRRKASLPCRANGAHGMTSGISGEVGECRGWGSTSTCELVFKGLRAQAVGSKHVPYALTGAAL